MTKKMKSEKIKNLKGMLCHDIDGKAFIQVYGADHSFRDYRIAHNDLQIQVKDDDAFACLVDGEWIIDHSPATLGTSGSGAKGDIKSQMKGKTCRTKPFSVRRGARRR